MKERRILKCKRQFFGMSEEPAVTIREPGKGEEGEFVYKICILGEPAVGKTSLIRNYVKKQFETEHIKTVGVDISKQPLIVDVEGKKISINLMFWDLAGQAMFHMLHKVYLNGAKGVIIAFDLTRSKTLVNAESWYLQCKKYGYDDVPKILVGNKADLKDKREVSEEAIKKQLENLGIADSFETSALDGINVEKLFETLARKVHKRENG